MAENDKRESERKDVQITSYIRKERPGGGYALMQFMSKDLSEGGIFVVTEDLNLFDIGEEVTLIVDKNKERLYEGSARVVRSTREFESEGKITGSGFGLMFVSTDDSFKEMVREQLEEKAS